MEHSRTEPENNNSITSSRSFALWLSWQELNGRGIVFTINVVIIAFLVALPVTLDLMGKARTGTVNTRIDYIGPSMSLVPKGIGSSDLVTAQLRGLTFSHAVHDNIRRDVSSLLRASEVRLITRLTVEGRDIPVVGINFGAVYSYPFSRYSITSSEVLLGEIIAQKLKKEKGEEIRIGPKPFTITGIIETTGGIDDVSIFMSLPVLQKMTGQKDRINEIRLFPRSAGSFESLHTKLDDYMSIIDIINSYRGDVAEKDVDTTLQTYQKAVYTAAFMLIALCIIISTYINLDGRKAEIATVYTLGARRGIILQVLTVRTIWITLLGSMAGQLLAFIATVIQDPHVQFRQVWCWTSFASVVLGTILLGLLVTTPFSFYSVYKRNLIEHL